MQVNNQSMNHTRSKDSDKMSPGPIGRGGLVLLSLCLLVFNEISGYFFQSTLYGFSSVFYIILFFISIEHYILFRIQHAENMLDGESKNGILMFKNSKQYRLSSLVFRIEPQTACLVLVMCWFFQIFLIKNPGSPLLAPVNYPEVFLIFSVILSLVTFILMRYTEEFSRKIEVKELSAILPYLMVAVILTGSNALLVILSRFDLSWPLPLLKFLVILFNFIILFEFTINTFINFYSEKKYPLDSTPLYNNIILTTLLLPGKNDLAFSDMVENRFGINIRDIWIIEFIKKYFIYLFTCQILLFWTLTCFVVVNPEESGIRECFGRRVSQIALQPGLYAKLPFPFERIIRYKTKEIKTITIGYEGDRTVRNLFWSTTHFLKAFNFCLGEGRELITVNVDIDYMIDDVFDYHYLHSDPVAEVRSLGYATFTEKTVHRNIQEVLSMNRNEFLEGIKTEISKKVKSEKLGVKIINISMNEIHPPSVVSNAYQDVVSSKIKAVALKLNAKRDAIKKILGYEKTALGETNRAYIYHSSTIATASGEVSSYLEKYRAYRISPNLFKKRLYMDTVEKKWKDSKITVVDHTLQAKNNQELWLHLKGEKKVK